MNFSLLRQLFLAVGLWASAGSLAPAYALPPSLLACSAEADDARRLACFDREIALLEQQPGEKAAVATTLSAEQRFGLTEQMARKELEKERSVPPPPKALHARAIAVTQRVTGELVITLENHQVWIELAPTSFRLAAGDEVTLAPGALRSFFMTGPSGKSTRVKRSR